MACETMKDFWREARRLQNMISRANEFHLKSREKKIHNNASWVQRPSKVVDTTSIDQY